MSRNIRVYIRRDGDGNRVLHYSYRATADMSFCFHLLSEVGEPWQALAKIKLNMLLRLNPRYELKVLELDRAPWIVEALVKKQTVH